VGLLPPSDFKVFLCPLKLLEWFSKTIATRSFYEVQLAFLHMERFPKSDDSDDSDDV